MSPVRAAGAALSILAVTAVVVLGLRMSQV
jgi:hypothetical protein